MKKVLIITYSFPPVNNIAAKRYGDLSKYIENNGWIPYIITTNSSDALRVPISEENIIRVGEHPSEQYNQSIKRNKNLKAKFLTLKRNLGFNLRLIDRTYFNWYKQVKKLDMEELKKKNFDVIIASFGPGSALFIGKYLSRKLNVPWCADFRDLGALYKDDFFKKNMLMKKLDCIVEKRLLKTTKAIITVSNGLKEEISEKYKLPIYVIYNGWDDQTLKCNTLKKALISTKKPYLYYAGRFYLHQLNSLYVLFDALKESNLCLKIRSLGPLHVENLIKEKIQVEHLHNKVDILPPTSLDIVEKEAEGAEINLVLEDLDEKYEWKKGTLTGKFLPLLIRKPPILAIARRDSDIGKILSETNKGRLCVNVGEVTNFFQEYRNDSQVNQEKIKYYSKRSQAVNLANILNSVIEDR